LAKFKVHEFMFKWSDKDRIAHSKKNIYDVETNKPNMAHLSHSFSNPKYTLATENHNSMGSLLEKNVAS